MPQDKPKIGLNLDTIEREGEVPEPFWITLGGKPYRLADPEEINWSNLVRLTHDPMSFLSAAIEADKHDEFMTKVNRLPAWKVNRLGVAYRKHYGLPDDPEANASPAS